MLQLMLTGQCYPAKYIMVLGGVSMNSRHQIAELLLAIIPLALGYFSGIIFLSSYLSKFAISIHQIPFDIPTVLSHSYNAAEPGVIVFFLIIYLVVATVWVTSSKNETLPDVLRALPIQIGALLVLLTLLFMAAYHSARSAGERRAEAVMNGQASLVTFLAPLDDTRSHISARSRAMLRKCIQGDRLRHIISTSTWVFAYCAATSREGLVISQHVETAKFAPLKVVAR